MSPFLFLQPDLELSSQDADALNGNAIDIVAHNAEVHGLTCVFVRA